MVWTGIHCVGPQLQLRNHCIAPIKCNGMEALLCISMMIPELSQNGCDVSCKARSYITALLTKTTVVKASNPLIEYLPVQIWQLESHQKGWNVKSASFLPHDPFIGGSIGCKRAPPPSHPTGNFGKVVCWRPFPGELAPPHPGNHGSATFANFLMILSLVDLWGTREPPHPTPQETLAKLYVGTLSLGSWLHPIQEIMDLPLLQIFS